MSKPEFIRRLLASAAARGRSAKEAAGKMLKVEAATAANLMSAPIKPAEERGLLWVGLCLSFASLPLAYSQIPESNRKEDKMTKLLEEVQEIKELIHAGFDNVLKAKEAGLKIMKEKKNKSWFEKFWR